MWPLALAERFSGRDASRWYRDRIRGALRFGGCAVVAGLVALAWPLVFSALVPVNGPILGAYAVALLCDGALFVAWLILAVRYSMQAARGETFVALPFARTTRSSQPAP